MNTSNTDKETIPEPTKGARSDIPAMPTRNYAAIGRGARAASMVLALFAGIFHVAMLWQYPLSMDTLLEAGRGFLLLLLAMGLMGTARLSLVLVIVFCLTSLLTIGAASENLRLMSIIEVALTVLAAIALLLSQNPMRGT